MNGQEPLQRRQAQLAENILGFLNAYDTDYETSLLSRGKTLEQAQRLIGREWSDWVMREMPCTEQGGIQHSHAELENRGQLWDDTLFMTVLFLAKAGRLLDRPDYVEEAEYQFLLHARYLTDRATGLWYHGWSFEERTHFAGALWGRGNCWVTLFVPEFLQIARPGPAACRCTAPITVRRWRCWP